MKPFKECSCRNPETGNRLYKQCPKLKNKGHGKWYARYSAPTLPGEKRRQPKLGPFDTMDEAKEAVAKAVGKGGRAARPEDLKMTLGDLLERRHKRRVQEQKAGDGLSPRTTQTDREIIDLYLKPGLGHVKVVDITEDQILDLYTEIRLINTPDEPPKPSETGRRLSSARASFGQRRYSTRPVSESRLRRIHAVLTGALNEAAKSPLKIIEESPANGVLKARSRSHKAKVKPLLWTDERTAYWVETGKIPGKVMVWTGTQTGAFLDFAKPERLYPMFHLAAYWGPRRGEVARLDRHEMSVDRHRFFVRADPDDEEDFIKTETSDRYVIFDDGTAVVMSDWFALKDAEREQWGELYTDSGRVFTYEDGQPLKLNYITQKFNEIYRRYVAVRQRFYEQGWTVEQIARRHRMSVERVRIAIDGPVLPPIRFHDLRHGAATMALAAGVPLKVVSDMLGHADQAFTANVYAVVSEELGTEAANLISSFIAQFRGGAAPSEPTGHERQPRLCEACAAENAA
ncbi:tyrosine-type recombinase/integrase [Actinomadura rudentiformis]|uniref:Tyrosine-type recombinase/integrase n=1 Tax=Actinomadura rudentiformis TaxID=359158 RepID=A0A6H9YUE9_9ACTN|nr:tyrosine-type recombinase/integrase [Actinomadura rudentiformis]KAB2344918.1 tyrosine-type recombinase/integrase [Actinomadura rudentiformis]